MVFGKKKEAEEQIQTQPVEQYRSNPHLIVVADRELQATDFNASIANAIKPVAVASSAENISPADIGKATAVLTVGLPRAALEQVQTAVLEARRRRADGTPVLVAAFGLEQLVEYGGWIHGSAAQDRLEGTRLILATGASDIIAKLPGKLDPFTEPNVVKMPTSPEIPNSPVKNMYSISPELRHLVFEIRGLAENGVTRIYLLGGPGTGKSTVAYYYWLCRKKGNFIACNLTAESTGDKAAMKSLLCGHVAGAFPGSGSREGALSFAKDGVCFLDESHGVTGVVMQVLMEVLDSGQFLPFGATAKRQLECAVLFASNRSWEHLRNLIHLDEHARLGATLLKIPDLVAREEDLIAVLATTLAKFNKQCTTWKAPVGLDVEAWNAIKGCTWRGNIRTLIRTLETASVSYALQGSKTPTLQRSHIDEGLNLWEPSDHKDNELFVSYR